MAKHRVCPHCNQKFKMKDEVVLTDARGGGTDLVHSDCLYDWVLNCSLLKVYLKQISLYML